MNLYELQRKCIERGIVGDIPKAHLEQIIKYIVEGLVEKQRLMIERQFEDLLK